MQICGVVAEFNPFHNGHLHLINSIRNAGADGIVCVMSGNFVQRGEPAIISKFARAKAAVLSGADLILELPLPYSISTAMFFANGAIDILNSLGVVDTICFGSECGDTEKLKTAANILSNEKMPSLLKEQLKLGVSFATARQSAAEILSDSDALSVLTTPNDTLGLEYIMAADRLKANLDFYAIKRLGAEHDSNVAVGNICSATLLREKFKTCPAELLNYMPKQSYDVLKAEATAGRIADYSLLERAIVAHLRTISPENLKNAPDVSEGLENRIILAANRFSNLEDIIGAVKSKRYTHARLRRIILSSYLGVSSGLRLRKAPYIRVLAMNEKGAEILASAKGKSSLFVVSSLKDAERLAPDCKQFTSLEVNAGDIYSLMLQKPTEGKTDFTSRLYKTF